MKTLAAVLALFLFTGAGFAQQASTPPDLTLGQLNVSLQNPPQTVNFGSAVNSGNPGPAAYYYWVVSNYAIGNSTPAGPFIITNAPNTLGVSNGVTVSWRTASGATSYDLLRTSTSAMPVGACNCAVATGVTGSSATDQSNTLNTYTVTSLDPRTKAVTLSNQGGTLTIPNLAVNGPLAAGVGIFGGGTPWFDVTSGIFKAACDGVTDDTTAFRAVIAATAILGGNIFIPDNSTCVIATNSSPALSLDLDVHTGIICGIPSGYGRPGGGTTDVCVLKFTGTPAIALSARGSFGVGINGLELQATNPSFTGTILDASHSPGDIGCGGNPCDTENINLLNSTISGVGSGCTVGMSLDKVITSTVTNNHLFGCVTQLKGASGSGSYSNINKIRDNDFNAASATTCFITNPGETWTVAGNTFEVNAATVGTLCNSGGFADTSGLDFSDNWDGDDTGAGGYTKYTLPANTVAHFASDEITAVHNNVNAFSIGNNSQITFSGGMFYAGGSTFGTMFTLGTGVSLDMAPASYGTFTTFISGTPSSGTLTTATGDKRTFGKSGFNLALASTAQAAVHAAAVAGNSTGAIPTITGTAGIIGDSSVDTSGAAGAGKVYGVIGAARTLNSLAGDKSYGGWFKSQGVNSSAEEVAVHAEVSDAQLNSTILEGAVQGVNKFRFDGFGNFYFTNLLISPTAPTIAGAGCGGASASIASNNGTASFAVNVGTTPLAACTITMPAATTGWNCFANDVTTNSASVFVQKQSPAASQTTTSVVITNFNDVAAAVSFTASDILQVSCFAR